MTDSTEQNVLQAYNRIVDVLKALEDASDPCVRCIFEDADKAFEEWKPMIVHRLSEGLSHSTVNDLFNLVVRPTAIGTEYYLRENVTGQATSLVNRIDW